MSLTASFMWRRQSCTLDTQPNFNIFLIIKRATRNGRSYLCRKMTGYIYLFCTFLFLACSTAENTKLTCQLTWNTGPTRILIDYVRRYAEMINQIFRPCSERNYHVKKLNKLYLESSVTILYLWEWLNLIKPPVNL